MSSYTLDEIEQLNLKILIEKKLKLNPNYTYEELDQILDRSWHQ